MAQTPMWGADCPRCGQLNTTFDLKSYVEVPGVYGDFEVFAACRACREPSIARLRSIGMTSFADLAGKFVNSQYMLVEFVFVASGAAKCPDHVPEHLKTIFDEAAKCLAIGCFSAAGTMFRKAIDVATREMLPTQPADDDKNHPDFIAWKVRKDLRLRLNWLLANGRVTKDISEVIDCVREDGNDAAHDLIGPDEALDLMEFTTVFFESLFTLPGQIEANRARRQARRNDA